MTDHSTDNSDAPNEILAAAKAHRRVATSARQAKKSWPLARIGIAAGIGSAAVAAAVLFANRKDKA